ncbi:MAG: hypothetical protein FWD68_15685 [Alphaproteobacteria bacterium]|nr:hypothetical protein [Alphaproteobacteria bacterium]
MATDLPVPALVAFLCAVAAVLPAEPFLPVAPFSSVFDFESGGSDLPEPFFAPIPFVAAFFAAAFLPAALMAVFRELDPDPVPVAAAFLRFPAFLARVAIAHSHFPYRTNNHHKLVNPGDQYRLPP